MRLNHNDKKNKFIIIIFLFLFHPILLADSLTLPYGNSYKGDAINGKPHGHGTETASWGTYQGEWVKGKKEGSGVLSQYGNTYKGLFENNKANGFGTLTLKSGEQFSGDWEQGFLDYATDLTFSSGGNRLEGSVVQGKIIGYGKKIYSYNRIEEGLFKNGKFISGILLYHVRGTSYSGEWSDGKKHGKGTLTNTNGIYIGDFENGIKQGQGEFTWPSGAKYNGSWKGGSWRDGYGEYTWVDGKHYEGSFLNGDKHGIGTLTKKNVTYTGNFKKGIKHGQGKITWSNGDKYEGSWVDGNWNGYGEYTWSDGEHYKGNFINDDMSGQGVLYYSNGDVFEGNWKKDQREGRGTLKYSNGRVFEGKWKNGHREGRGLLTLSSGESYKGKWKKGKSKGATKFLNKIADKKWDEEQQEIYKAFDRKYAREKRMGMHDDDETPIFQPSTVFNNAGNYNQYSSQVGGVGNNNYYSSNANSLSLLATPNNVPQNKEVTYSNSCSGNFHQCFASCSLSELGRDKYEKCVTVCHQSQNSCNKREWDRKHPKKPKKAYKKGGIISK